MYDKLTTTIISAEIKLWINESGCGGLILNAIGGDVYAEIHYDFGNLTGSFVELRVAPEYQKLGISKVILRNVVELFVFFQFKTFDYYAVEVGSYLAAKAGFLPSQEEWFRLREELKQKVYSSNLSKEKMDEALEILSSDDPKALWKFSDL